MCSILNIQLPAKLIKLQVFIYLWIFPLMHNILKRQYAGSCTILLFKKKKEKKIIIE